MGRRTWPSGEIQGEHEAPSLTALHIRSEAWFSRNQA